MVREPCSIYIHVPFCSRKCPYCHFYSIAHRKELVDLYYHALLEEIALWMPTLKDYEIITLYFGGGTPSLLCPEYIQSIIEKVAPQASAEITIEVNPETATRELFLSFKTIGINRLSVGVQSFHDTELKALSRPHNSKKAIETVEMAEDSLFDNISIDLMYEIPHQTLESFRTSLEIAGRLPISHISLYNLTMEENTPFFRKKEELLNTIVPQEVGVKMYTSAQEILGAHGFCQYEISAFCKDKKRSLHNIGYWQGRPFLGFGPSAFSYFRASRFSNVSSVQEYAKLLEKKILPATTFDELDPVCRQKELLAVGLRMNEGIEISSLPQDLETHSALVKLIDDGLLVREETRIKLSRRGILFYDEVASRLI
jgi:oxygen-independent coproporphyrinogen III oxidase